MLFVIEINVNKRPCDRNKQTTRSTTQKNLFENEDIQNNKESFLSTASYLETYHFRCENLLMSRIEGLGFNCAKARIRPSY